MYNLYDIVSGKFLGTIGDLKDPNKQITYEQAKKVLDNQPIGIIMIHGN